MKIIYALSALAAATFTLTACAGPNGSVDNSVIHGAKMAGNEDTHCEVRAATGSNLKRVVCADEDTKARDEQTSKDWMTKAFNEGEWNRAN